MSSALSRHFTLANAIRAMMLFGIFVLFGVLIQSCSKPKTGVDSFAIGTLADLTRLEMKLSDLRGKVVLVNAWGTFCPPCVVEMPTLDALETSRAGEDFAVVTISVDRQAADAAAWISDNGLSLTPWHDSSYTLTSSAKLPGFPTTILYDRYGTEVARLAGEADWNAPEVIALIDYLTAY